MEIHKRIVAEGNKILQRLEGQGVSFEVIDKNTLRITVKTTLKQFELVRLWKQRIIEALSPHCANCGLPMQIINNGELWFCPFGCESKKRHSKTRLDK